jgi:hypothetical protein
MDRHVVLQTALTIAFNTGVYLPIIMDGYAGPQTILTIAFHKVL